MEFAEATSVSFSYKKLSRVDYLAPFRDLTKLQLDNNALTRSRAWITWCICVGWT